MPNLVKFGCSFNLGDKFPRFPVRAMIFKLILRYHWLPNGPEERHNINLICAQLFEHTWAYRAFNQR
ncbi:hypothetical protein D8674_038874 [Pyrus ussuriensis x Pyrus communis]|uniref:Uncharacterized protein n=1 Tax=Pyrus ussuriensis x Pyrus communis TaxID=2448454 RepID=A0A5N5HBS9_9ROSA|nr:hypothetical protein D8674_038874 [Pyrus ussuriensis x Pyrus communis]